jgi:hypothetical protein
MKKLFFHTLSDNTIKKLIKNKTTWHDLSTKYLQPDWCAYPDALQGDFGCWALTDLFGMRHKISRDYCKNCDCFKNVKPESLEVK